MDILKRKEFIWTTYEGVEIRLCDIEDSHLANIITHLNKRIVSFQDQLKSFVIEFDMNDELVNDPIDKFVLEERIKSCQKLVKFLQREQRLRRASL